ncbi:MAG: phosphotransferase family protein [Rhizobiaceae bacterium]
MSGELEQRCEALISELGLGSAGDITEVRPLTGGVASDIAVVNLGDRTVCMKFALPKLKVAADWQAPVHRNAAEYAWLQVASKIAPDSAIELYGRSEALHGFAMEFLGGADIYLWKTRLLHEAPDLGEAEKVAGLLGKIHAASAQDGFDAGPFQNRDDFHALRIEPYLSYTAQIYPDLAPVIKPLEDMLYTNQRVLVHGDASPKNIMFRGSAPIVLDAECATMGDASFDPAFCMNHLVLKAVHLPSSRTRLLRDVEKFWHTYALLVTWESRDELEARICALLPVLMLARVDGKSPVEYLTEPERQMVRDISIPLITASVSRLDALVDRLTETLGEYDT